VGEASSGKISVTLELDPELEGRVLLGALVMDGVRVGGPGSAQQDDIGRLQEELRRRHAGTAPAGIDGLQAARRLYRAVGIDPTKIRPSSEALLRRVLKGGSLYRINNLVDAANQASLEFLLPLGLYDRDRIKGSAKARLGCPGEGFPGIRKDRVRLEKRLGLFDEEGAFGSPTSDSPRTCITERTKDILSVVFVPGDYPLDRLRAHLERLAELFGRWCGAESPVIRILPRDR